MVEQRKSVQGRCFNLRWRNVIAMPSILLAWNDVGATAVNDVAS